MASLDTAIKLHKDGRLEAAERAYLEILNDNKDDPSALHLLGVIRQQQCRHDEALQLIGQAVAANPAQAVYHSNYGAALVSLERYAEAEASFCRALAIRPNYADAFANLGMAQAASGNDPAAEQSFRRALECKPWHRDATTRLASLLQRNCRTTEAAWLLESALAATPCVPFYMALGILSHSEGQTQRAAEQYRAAIALQVDNGRAYFNLAQALEELRDMPAAQQHFARAAELCPEKPLWRMRTEMCGPLVFENTEEIEEHCQRAETILREWIAEVSSSTTPLHKPNSHRPNLFPKGEGSLATDGARTLPATYALKDIMEAGVYPSFVPSSLGRNPRRLRERFAEFYGPCFRNQPLPTGSGSRERPRVGFLVTRRHEGMFLQSMRGIIEKLDGRRFDPVILCSRAIVETLRTGIRRDGLRFIPFGDSLPEAIRQIRERACDLVYYWEVGSDAMNYFLPFARLAPVQCTSWGFTVTSGIPAVDWYMSSDLVEDDDSQSHYTERLWRSRTLFRYQDRLRLRPPAQLADFGLPDNRHLYVCFQNPLKLHPDFDSIMVGILAADPRALIVLMRDRAGQVARLLEQRLSRRILQKSDRIVFLPPQPFDEYCRLLCLADVVLDPLHFGANSSCYDIFSFNLPMVTLPTNLMSGRMALGFYRKMQFEELVVSTPEDYVSKSVQVATDRDYRQHVTNAIAQRSDVLFNDLEAVREHERFFHDALAAVGPC